MSVQSWSAEFPVAGAALMCLAGARVDALALIEMVNQVNPTLGQWLIGDAFEVGAQSLGY